MSDPTIYDSEREGQDLIDRIDELLGEPDFRREPSHGWKPLLWACKNQIATLEEVLNHNRLYARGYDEGVTAGPDEQFDNPYPKDSPEHDGWDDGWRRVNTRF